MNIFRAMRVLRNSIPRPRWESVAIVGGGLFLVFGATWLIMTSRRGGLRERESVVPLWREAQGLAPGRLERSLPRGAFAVVGIRGIQNTWEEIKGTNFGKAMLAQAGQHKGRFPSVPAWIKLLGPSALAAAYGESDVAGPRALLLLAEAAPQARQADLRRLLGESAADWYIGLVKDVWVISQNRVLATQAGELVQKTPRDPPAWLSQALLTVPARSTVYFAFHFDALKPATPAEAAAWEDEQPLVWSAGGAYFRNYLWTEAWGERRPGNDSSSVFREAPRKPAFPFPRESHPVFFFSYLGDLGRLVEKSQEKSPNFLPGIEKLSQSTSAKTASRLARHLGDEAGIFLSQGTGQSLLPPVAFFARLKHFRFARWSVGRALKKQGWSREGDLWTYAPAGGALPIRLSLGFHQGFVVLGSKTGVEALTRKPSGLVTSSFSSLLAALSGPDRINSLVCLDARGVGETLFAAYAAWRPKAKPPAFKEKAMDILETVPPLAGYAVNTREGVYSRWLLNAQDRSQSRWGRLLERATPGAVFIAAPPAAKQEPRFLIEQDGDETRVTIRSVQFPIDPEAAATVPPSPVTRANLMKDPDWMVRRDVARAMIELGTPADLPALRRLLEDPVASVRDAARAAIDRIDRRR